MRNLLFKAGLLATALLVAGCASPPPRLAPSEIPALFKDAAFKPLAQAHDDEAIFALSPEMRQFMKKEVAEQVRHKGARWGLVDALYHKRKLLLDYDAAITRNASEAFEARAGNCLSLVIMTAAFAKEMGLGITYQQVTTESNWSRMGSTLFLAGHVNVTLGRRWQETAAFSLDADSDRGMDSMTIDFVPPELGRAERIRKLDERTLVAMFYNNRAAEAMVANELDQAYWLARAAIDRDPNYVNAYNTLGVIYRRHGDLLASERVLRRVYELEPNNPQVIGNLVVALRDMGQHAEADQLQRRLDQLQPDPPYAFFDRGVAAMNAGNFVQARDLFRKEISRAAYVPEFHFWMALADLRLGDLASASKHMESAKDYSTTIKDRDIYATKLDKIKGYRATGYKP
ncbi:tetratricopeptide repeat protein [Pelomonas sp. V22]|uniref:tetratricopeptide repeat protein n=1 Tax=Pelomonas sp. V22 TaxID=2822139 RepID=UPI0024A9AFED|nr:tetratricopeptide repeat protein [Pelomonas sp. V22]MDI4633629.1 tetratricopeptide repeat protein [Pelomonas sp. V22]